MMDFIKLMKMGHTKSGNSMEVNKMTTSIRMEFPEEFLRFLLTILTFFPTQLEPLKTANLKFQNIVRVHAEEVAQGESRTIFF